MASVSPDAAFIVWGIDQTPYGPVELPTLVSWVRDERITTDTWIFAARERSWQKAADLPELKRIFQDSKAAVAGSSPTLQGIDLGSLRRIKILAALSDEQLARFAQFIEVEKVSPGVVVVQEGVCDDTMYLVLEGELAVRMKVLDGEAALATLGAGDFVGDISLFDQGPRTANVIANRNSVLLKISAAAFQRLSKESPDLSTPFLLAIGKTLTARIRAGSPPQAIAVVTA
jgi:NTE family protein